MTIIHMLPSRKQEDLLKLKQSSRAAGREFLVPVNSYGNLQSLPCDQVALLRKAMADLRYHYVTNSDEAEQVRVVMTASIDLVDAHVHTCT